MTAGFLWQDAEISPNLHLETLEKDTIKRLYQFPEAVIQAGEELSPAIIANYIYDLAKVFNQFYQELPVLKEENNDKKLLRLFITSFVGSTIKKSMKLLGIEVPQKM